MVVGYNNPTRRARGREYKNTPFVYACTRRTPEGRPEGCQSPAGPHIDRTAVQLMLFALGQLDLDGLREVVDARSRRDDEARRVRARQIEALARRVSMLEESIGDATTSEARTRLVARFERLRA
jgi:hypothetical protein